MKVKRYTGSSLEKIRQVILKELGEDAVIINMKEKVAKKGLLAGGAKKFEVIAAVEEFVNTDEINLEEQKDNESKQQLEELINEQKQQYIGLRKSIKLLDEKLAEVDEHLEKQALTVQKQDVIPQLVNIHDEWRPKVVKAAMELASSETPTLDDWCEGLATMVPTAGGIMFRPTPGTAPDIYVLAGPTGVGKTTTLAKLAAKAVLGEHLNVGFITTDTFRIAAVDQLREYASLLGVEISVAFTSVELKQQLEIFHDKDVVFIDTPGRGQKDVEGINSIAETLKNIEGICVLLTVPATVRKEDVDSIVGNYGVLNPSALIITKTDEASCCDGLTTLLEKSELPVIYLTDGQRVPEDIHVATPGLVVSLIIPYEELPV